MMGYLLLKIFAKKKPTFCLKKLEKKSKAHLKHKVLNFGGPADREAGVRRQRDRPASTAP